MNIRFIFGLIVLVMLASTIGLLAFVEIPKGNENTFVQMVGTLSTLSGMIVGFYFGDSETRRRKESNTTTSQLDNSTSEGKDNVKT